MNSLIGKYYSHVCWPSGHGQSAVRYDPARVSGASAVPARSTGARVSARAGPTLQVFQLPPRLRRRGTPEPATIISIHVGNPDNP